MNSLPDYGYVMSSSYKVNKPLLFLVGGSPLMDYTVFFAVDLNY